MGSLQVSEVELLMFMLTCEKSSHVVRVTEDIGENMLGEWEILNNSTIASDIQLLIADGQGGVRTSILLG